MTFAAGTRARRVHRWRERRACPRDQSGTRLGLRPGRYRDRAQPGFSAATAFAHAPRTPRPGATYRPGSAGSSGSAGRHAPAGANASEARPYTGCRPVPAGAPPTGKCRVPGKSGASDGTRRYRNGGDLASDSRNHQIQPTFSWTFSGVAMLGGSGCGQDRTRTGSGAAAAGAAIPAPAALHLFDRPARTEPYLDLDDLEIVHAKGAKSAAEPFARPLHVEHPLHVRLPAAVTAVSRPVSSSPSPDAAR